MRLLALDPLGFWNVHLGEHYLAAGDRAKAREQCRRAVELDANSGPARGALGHMLLVDGRLDEAMSQLETAHRLDPEDGGFRRWLVEAYEKAGRSADAARLRAETAGRTP
jgi:predicted Zn-dependent protease